MRRQAFALALLAGGFVTSGGVLASPVIGEADLARITEVALTYERIKFENDTHVLALALYWEGGSTGESIEGMRRIAEVIKTRAALNRSDFGGRDLHGVVFHSHRSKAGKGASVCQFSFACLASTKRAPIPGPRWELARQVARGALRDDSRPAEHEVAEYYLNPEFSSLRSICWFKTKLVEAGQTGRHIFWREPKHWDQPREAAAKPEECVRYEAMAELQKRKAVKQGKSKKQQVAKAKTKKSKQKFASNTRR